MKKLRSLGKKTKAKKKGMLSELPTEVFSDILGHLNLNEVCAARGLSTSILEGIDYWHAQELCETLLRDGFMKYPQMTSPGDFVFRLNDPAAKHPFSQSKDPKVVTPLNRQAFTRFLTVTGMAPYVLRIILFHSSETGIAFDWKSPFGVSIFTIENFKILEEDVLSEDGGNTFLHPKGMSRYIMYSCKDPRLVEAVFYYLAALQKVHQQDSGDSALFKPLSSIALRGFTLDYFTPNRKESARVGSTPQTSLLELAAKLFGPELTSLDLTACEGTALEAERMAAILRQCPKLEHLHLSIVTLPMGPTQEPDAPKQSKVHGSHMSILVSDAIATSCPSLRGLYLRNAHCLTHEALISVAKSCRATLETLDLAFLKGDGTTITTGTIVELVAVCSKLSTLNLSVSASPARRVAERGIFTIANEALVAISKSNCASNFKSLAIAHQSVITDEGLIALVKRCPKLEHLDISGLGNKLEPSISDAAMLEVAAHCPELKSLTCRANLPDNSRFSSGSSVKDHHGVTATGFEAIANGCKKLKRLEHNGALLSEKVLAALKAAGVEVVDGGK